MRKITKMAWMVLLGILFFAKSGRAEMIIASEVDVLKALTSQLGVLTSENCLMDPQLRNFLGVGIGDQVLLEKSNELGKWGLVTIYGDFEDGSDNDDLRMRLSARERFDESDSFEGIAYAWTPYVDKTISWLETNNGLGEFLDESCSFQTSLLILAPHGGMIEQGTAEIGEKISELLGNSCVDYSFWNCRGWQNQLGAYNAWHITSTDLSENTFTLLGEVSNREFDRAISLHGFSESYIAVGGGGSSSFKEGIRDALLAIPKFPFTVTLVTSGSYAGVEERNIVNRYSSNGVQIEMPLSARTTWNDEIAEAIAEYLTLL